MIVAVTKEKQAKQLQQDNIVRYFRVISPSLRTAHIIEI